MTLRRSVLLVAGWLASASPALAALPHGAGLGVEEAALSPGQVVLVRPAAGALLVGGSTAEIEWAPAAGAALPPALVEWEAFLSLDGGATHPFRLTPHLDLDHRRFTFPVPGVASTEARLLLRFGDEHQEMALEPGLRFEIVLPPGATVPYLAPRALSILRGEPARRGEEGVISWVEGNRSGGALRQVEATEESWGRDRPPVALADGEILADTEDSPSSDGAAAIAESVASPVSPEHRQAPSLAVRRATQFDILLQTHRRNE